MLSLAAYSSFALANTIPVILLTTTSTLTTIAGIGGGALIFPILTVFTPLNPQSAVPISKFIILSSAAFSFIVNYQGVKQHYDPVIFELIVPFLIAGTCLGVCFTTLIPDKLLVLILVIVLVQNAYKIWCNLTKNSSEKGSYDALPLDFGHEKPSLIPRKSILILVLLIIFNLMTHHLPYCTFLKSVPAKTIRNRANSKLGQLP